MKRIPLHNRRGDVVARTIVDDEDFEWLSRWRWQLQKSGHVARRDNSRAGGGRTIGIHRCIMERIAGRPLARGELVHHAGDSPLDNRRSKLKLVSRAEHCAIHGGMPRPLREANPLAGICRVPSGRLRAMCAGRYLGTFDTVEDAQAAREEAKHEATG